RASPEGARGPSTGRALRRREQGRQSWSTGMNEVVNSPATRRPRGLTLGSIVLLLLAILGVLALALTKRSAEAKERRQRGAAAEAGPTVRVAGGEVSPAERALTLPAEVRAWAQSTLYAKVAGYVREVPVDKGSKVKKGDLLARLESPETDQAVLAARADLQVKKVQAERLRKPPPPRFVAQQDPDNPEGAYSAAKATPHG